jgi:malonate transporter and related proteins
MNAILETILPVFGLIAVGIVAAKTNYISAAAARGLSHFVFNLAIPALLFRTVATMELQRLSPWPLWIAIFGGIAIVWTLTAFAARKLDTLAEGGGATASMSAGFGNIAMLGLPLSIAHFGPAMAVPVSLVLAIHAPVLWLAATVHIETARHGHIPSLPMLLRQLMDQLARNPIVVALLAGALWRATGWGLHPVADRFLDLLGGAGVPSALVALGLSLASYSLKGQWSGIGLIIAMKMALLPFAVWLLATYAVDMPALWRQAAILLAAMPTGANAYLFAQRYASGEAAASGAIAAGTALSLFTTALLLFLFDHI